MTRNERMKRIQSKVANPTKATSDLDLTAQSVSVLNQDDNDIKAENKPKYEDESLTAAEKIAQLRGYPKMNIPSSPGDPNLIKNSPISQRRRLSMQKGVPRRSAPFRRRSSSSFEVSKLF